MFELRQVVGCGDFEFCLGPRGHLQPDGLPEVVIQTLLRILLRAITGQVEEFDPVLARCKGIEKVGAEWKLVCMALNLRQMAYL